MKIHCDGCPFIGHTKFCPQYSPEQAISTINECAETLYSSRKRIGSRTDHTKPHVCFSINRCIDLEPTEDLRIACFGHQQWLLNRLKVEENGKHS